MKSNVNSGVGTAAYSGPSRRVECYNNLDQSECEAEMSGLGLLDAHDELTPMNSNKRMQKDGEMNMQRLFEQNN
jgi:hypothetical protein